MNTSAGSQSAHQGYGFAGTLPSFLEASIEAVVGALTTAASRPYWAAIESQQVMAWEESLRWLRHTCEELLPAHLDLGLPHLCLEFEIPRRGGRIDAILLVRDLIFVVEFKAKKVDHQARRQVEDYALELLDFHERSQGRRIFPVVCAKGAPRFTGDLPGAFGVATVSTCNPMDLPAVILELYARFHEAPEERSEILPADWLAATYSPTPTILEAARALYAGHRVGDLSNSKASREHLERSFSAIVGAIEKAQREGLHTIVFLTGIPGAGKTLAGMNVVHGTSEDVNAAFLSGNGPLVRVLQDVLARDLARRTSTSKKAALLKTKTLVQNVHRWLDEYVDRQRDAKPFENVVIFDEAQRAWDREQSKRKFDRDASEPEMILEVMERRTDWGVIVALIGGGQEINTGEAGLAEWGRALLSGFKDWQIHVSPQLLAGDASTAGSCLFPDQGQVPMSRVTVNGDLHLRVSQRSFRSTILTEWVEAFLGLQPDRARELMDEVRQSFPLVLTRDLEVARRWLRHHARGERRMGLLAGSGSRRLRQYGVSVAERVDEVTWFLNTSEDVRSSDFLELALSEFGVQGLELDWTCVAWGGDLLPENGAWRIRRFRGTRWEEVHQEFARAYVINRYRVLMTRAREGSVIWVPPGAAEDPTRDPQKFDSVAAYLKRCGVEEL